MINDYQISKLSKGTDYCFWAARYATQEEGQVYPFYKLKSIQTIAVLFLMIIVDAVLSLEQNLSLGETFISPRVDYSCREIKMISMDNFLVMYKIPNITCDYHWKEVKVSEFVDGFKATRVKPFLFIIISEKKGKWVFMLPIRWWRVISFVIQPKE